MNGDGAMVWGGDTSSAPACSTQRLRVNSFLDVDRDIHAGRDITAAANITADALLGGTNLRLTETAPFTVLTDTQRPGAIWQNPLTGKMFKFSRSWRVGGDRHDQVGDPPGTVITSFELPSKMPRWLDPSRRQGSH